MFRRIIIFVSVVFFIADQASALQVRDARGVMVKLTHTPHRIVSLSPNNTEILFALGLGDRVVGVTRFCTYPPQARSKAKVGDMTMSSEAIIALKPDLVLAHAALQDHIIPKLEKLGLTVFAVDPKTIEQTISTIISIGEITGSSKKARAIASDMTAQLKSVVAKSRTLKKHSVLISVQANPLWAAGPKTIPNEMLSLLKMNNVAKDARPGYVTFSDELAIARNPELIVVGTKSDALYFKKASIWKTTPAVRNNRVVVIDPDTLVRPGPRLIKGLKLLAAKLSF